MECKNPSLPWDLLLNIVDFMPSGHLYPILLVSKTLHKAAERLLYRHINLANCPRRSIHFYHTIVEHPELARHVLTFQTAEYYFRAEGRLARAFRRFRHRPYNTKREVSYLHFSGLVIQNLANVGTICAYPTTIDKLENLHNIKRFRFHRLPAFSDYGALFDKIPNATHVEIPFTFFSGSSREIRPDHLPFLEEMICTMDIAMKVVPNRPVRSVFMMYPLTWEDPPSPYELLLAISQSSAKITVLGLIVRWIWQSEMVNVIHAIALLLPDVEELYLTLNFSKGAHVELQSFLNAVSIASHLTTLSLHLTLFSLRSCPFTWKPSGRFEPSISVTLISMGYLTSVVVATDCRECTPLCSAHGALNALPCPKSSFQTGQPGIDTTAAGAPTACSSPARFLNTLSRTTITYGTTNIPSRRTWRRSGRSR